MAARRAFFQSCFLGWRDRFSGVGLQRLFKDPDSAMTIGLGQGVFVMLGPGFCLCRFRQFLSRYRFRSRLSSADRNRIIEGSRMDFTKFSGARLRPLMDMRLICSLFDPPLDVRFVYRLGGLFYLCPLSVSPD